MKLKQIVAAQYCPYHGLCGSYSANWAHAIGPEARLGEVWRNQMPLAL
jgi:hypothetical protein